MPSESASPASLTHPASIADLIKKPHHTAFCVTDFDAALSFFVELLGFVVEADSERTEPELATVTAVPGARIRLAMLRLGDYRIELFRYSGSKHLPQAHPQDKNGLTHIGFEVSDVDAVYERILAAGYRATSVPVELRNGRSKLIYVYGPEELVVEFIELRDIAADKPAANSDHGSDDA